MVLPSSHPTFTFYLNYPDLTLATTLWAGVLSPPNSALTAPLCCTISLWNPERPDRHPERFPDII